MSDEPWHLDKRVPVALILTILMQTAAAVWFASALNQRVSQLETSVAAIGNTARDDEMRLRALELQAGRTDERLIGIQALLNDIKRILEERP